MKRIVLSVFFVAAIGSLFAQTVKPATKTAAAKPVAALKNIKDSASYAIGISVGNFYKQQGITSVNASVVARAIDDVLTGKKALLTEAAANACMNSYMMSVQQQKAKSHIDEGNAFLTKNKTRPGVTTTASGLQYEVITAGTGDTPGITDSVTCHYKGTFINGNVFESSYDNGSPIVFTLKGVIAGWTEGLQLMKAGSKYKFYIPYTLGYGPVDYNSITGGSTLVFEIELLKVKKNL